MKYNLQDADGHERGFMGKGKPKAKRVYQFVRKEGQRTYVTSVTAWGEVLNESFPSKTLKSYKAAHKT